MNIARCLLAIGLMSGLLLLGACGKSQDAPPPYNRTLGDSAAGTPLGTPSVDLGILQDPTGYQPASYTPLAGFAAVGTATAGGGSAEEQAVRQHMGDLFSAALEVDFDTMLEAFVPEQVEALQDHVSAMYETVDKLKVLLRTLEEKGENTNISDVLALLEKYAGRAAGVLTDSLAVEMLDEEHAAVGIDAEKAREAMRALEKEFVAELAELDPEGAAKLERSIQAAAQGMPETATGGGGEAQPAGGPMMPGGALVVPLTLSEGEWRIELPFAITEEQAQMVGDALAVAQSFFDKLNAKLDLADSVDETTVEMLARQTALEMLADPKAQQLLLKIQEVFGPGGNLGLTTPGGEAAGNTEGADKPEDESGGAIIRP